MKKFGKTIPKKFERLSTGKYRVICDGMMMAQKLLQHNGRRILPFDGYVEAEKIPYEMSFEEMLIYFEGKLITREMIGETQTFNGKGRRLRETSAVEPTTAGNSPKQNFSNSKGKNQNLQKSQKKGFQKKTEKEYHSNTPSVSGSEFEIPMSEKGGGRREDVPRESRHIFLKICKEKVVEMVKILGDGSKVKKQEQISKVMEISKGVHLFHTQQILQV